MNSSISDFLKNLYNGIMKLEKMGKRSSKNNNEEWLQSDMQQYPILKCSKTWYKFKKNLEKWNYMVMRYKT